MLIHAELECHAYGFLGAVPTPWVLIRVLTLILFVGSRRVISAIDKP